MKKLFILSLSFILFSFLVTPSFASLCPAGSQFTKLCDVDVTDHTTIIRDVINILFVIAGIIALLFLIYGGVRWILSGGDKAKIGEARATLVAAVTGLIITFLAFFIINLVSFFFGLNSGSIFVIPRLTNEKPLPPTNVNNLAPTCPPGGTC